MQDFIGARLALDEQGTVVLYQIDLVTLFEAEFAHKIGRQPDRERIPPFATCMVSFLQVDIRACMYIILPQLPRSACDDDGERACVSTVSSHKMWKKLARIRLLRQ